MHVAYRHHIVNRNIHVAHIHYRCAVMFAARGSSACAIHEYMIRCYTQPLPGEAEQYARAAALLAVPKSMLRPGLILQRGAEGFDVEGDVAAAARAHDEVEAIFNEAMVSCILRAWASCNIGKLRGCTAHSGSLCKPCRLLWQ